MRGTERPFKCLDYLVVFVAVETFETVLVQIISLVGDEQVTIRKCLSDKNGSNSSYNFNTYYIALVTKFFFSPLDTFGLS